MREIKLERIKREGVNGDILQAENGKNLKKVLHMKADKMDLERLFEIKCDKGEMDNLLGTQTTMHM
jgi:hypothetical protein